MRLRDVRPADMRDGLSWAADHLLGFRYQDKRLKLDGMLPPVKRLTITGLVTVVVLMVCLAHAAFLHIGAVYVLDGQRAYFALPAVAICAMAVNCIILIYGASQCAAIMRLAAAAGFIAILSFMATLVGSLGRSGSPLVDAIAITSDVCYLAVPVSLSVSAICAWLKRRPKWAEPSLGLVATIAAGGFFACQLAAYVKEPPQAIARNLIFAAIQLAYVALPLIYIAALSVVKLAYGVGQAGASLARSAKPYVRGVSLGVLVIAAAWFLGWHDRGRWTGSPSASAMIIAWCGAASIAMFVLRRRAPDPELADDEKFANHAALVLTVPELLVQLFVAAFFVFSSKFTSIKPAANFIYTHLNFTTPEYNRFVNDGYRILFAIMLLIALPVAIARKENAPRRQLALGYVFIAAWVLAGPAAVQVTGAGRAEVLIPLLACLGTLGVIAARRGKLSAGQLAALIGLLIFAWLAETDGTFIDIVGRLFGLSGNLILIVGVALTLLGDSEFVQKDGRLLPQRARPLLWVGYIGVSLTLTLLAQPDFVLNSGPFAFGELGWPLALWLVITGRLLPSPPKTEAEDAKENAGEQEPPEDKPRAIEGSSAGMGKDLLLEAQGTEPAGRPVEETSG